MNKLRVAVLFGGRSGEHEVSIVSAKSVISTIDKDKFEVIPIGITKEGKWITENKGEKAKGQKGKKEEDSKGILELKEIKGDSEFIPVILPADANQKSLIKLIPSSTPTPSSLTGEDKMRGVKRITNNEQRTTKMIPVDVIFPVLHGPYGEDGTIQGLCELADIPYVGAGVLSSAACMDKAITKSVLKEQNIPVADFVVIKRKELSNNENKLIENIENHFTYPCFIKPANMGSSVGISKAHNREELIKALHLAAKYDRKILVEEYVKGKEIECSVLGNDSPIASVLGEIIPCNEFYDYDAKYIDDRSGLIIPARLPFDVTKKVQEIAIKSFLAADCAGMARVDFFVTEDMKVYVNELNTIPGFTNISMYPKLWEASGLAYKDLITILIELAIERNKDKNKSLTHYDEG